MSLPTRPKEPEEVYAEYDENFGWCIFGTNSGFCYASMSTQQEAEQKAIESNKLLNNSRQALFNMLSYPRKQ